MHILSCSSAWLPNFDMVMWKADLLVTMLCFCVDLNCKNPTEVVLRSFQNHWKQTMSFCFCYSCKYEWHCNSIFDETMIKLSHTYTFDRYLAKLNISKKNHGRCSLLQHISNESKVPHNVLKMQMWRKSMDNRQIMLTNHISNPTFIVSWTFKSVLDIFMV